MALGIGRRSWSHGQVQVDLDPGVRKTIEKPQKNHRKP